MIPLIMLIVNIILDVLSMGLSFVWGLPWIGPIVNALVAVLSVILWARYKSMKNMRNMVVAIALLVLSSLVMIPATLINY